jgi:1-deoxyxylulose-5-phosphate synthase
MSLESSLPVSRPIVTVTHAPRAGSGGGHVADAVQAVATGRGLPPAQVAIAWLLGRDGITAPLIGATRAQHIEDAAAALAVRLSGAEKARLEAGYQARLLSDY